MLFSDMDLFGSHQGDIIEAIAEVEAGRVDAADPYADELGDLDLFGSGQLAMPVRL